MSTEKYLTAFKKVSELKETFVLAPNALLVYEVDPSKEAAKHIPQNRIVIAGVEGFRDNALTQKPVFARVLQGGTEAEYEPGDYILVGKNSIGKFSFFGKIQTLGQVDFGLTKNDEVIMAWKGQAGFDAYFDTLLKELL